MNRRDFLKSIGLGLASIPVLGTIAQTLIPSVAFAEDAKEADPIAKAMKYCENADAKNNAACPNRAKKENAKKYCNNCSFFAAVGSTKREACTILGGKLVAPKGYCDTWQKHAQAKI